MRNYVIKKLGGITKEDHKRAIYEHEKLIKAEEAKKTELDKFFQKHDEFLTETGFLPQGVYIRSEAFYKIIFSYDFLERWAYGNGFDHVGFCKGSKDELFKIYNFQDYSLKSYIDFYEKKDSKEIFRLITSVTPFIRDCLYDENEDFEFFSNQILKEDKADEKLDC